MRRMLENFKGQKSIGGKVEKLHLGKKEKVEKAGIKRKKAEYEENLEKKIREQRGFFASKQKRREKYGKGRLPTFIKFEKCILEKWELRLEGGY